MMVLFLLTLSIIANSLNVKFDTCGNDDGDDDDDDDDDDDSDIIPLL